MRIKMMKIMARSGKAICPICSNQRFLVEHHIHGRKIEEKNRKFNRVWLCGACHDSVHQGQTVIEGWASTSEGKKLLFRDRNEAPIANEGARPHLYDD
jgi:hypothetical protein